MTAGATLSTIVTGFVIEHLGTQIAFLALRRGGPRFRAGVARLAGDGEHPR